MLHEKTRVDRKTLKSINEGKPVKESTLQTIATHLRLPFEHLAPQGKKRRLSAPQEEAATKGVRELVLKPLNAKQLFELLSEISAQDNLSWTLKLDSAPSAILQQLIQFEDAVRDWLRILHDDDREGETKKSLKGQLGKIQTRADLETLIQAISAANIKIFGSTYIRWDFEMTGVGPYDDFPGVGEYRSSIHGYISVEPRNTTSSTVAVDEGDKPPPWFPDNQPSYLESIAVDGKTVWSRPPRPEPKVTFDDDGIPSWEDEQS